MIRPINLKVGKGILLLDDEKASDLLKEATFYMQMKWQKKTDEEFRQYLLLKQKEGYMEKDIEELKDDAWRGDYPDLISSVDKLPNYVSLVIDMLLEQNNMLKKQKIR